MMNQYNKLLLYYCCCVCKEVLCSNLRGRRSRAEGCWRAVLVTGSYATVALSGGGCCCCGCSGCCCCWIAGLSSVRTFLAGGCGDDGDVVVSVTSDGRLTAELLDDDAASSVFVCWPLPSVSVTTFTDSDICKNRQHT